MKSADWMVLATCIGLVWQMRILDAPVFASLEHRFAQLAKNKNVSLAAVGVATILARLALLPWLPVPQPGIHDEFSYLLAADTFAHGRLTNPPHPLWIFFDTFHVIQHPTYASMYPPAQGMILAIGKLLGHPWIGVLLSTAAMCVALTWMLQQWMPPNWALFGGVLVILRIGLLSYWMNSYWGGSVAALGAALVMGMFPRMLARSRLRDVFVFGAGVMILATSRPLEGFIFCAPVALALLWSSLRAAPAARRATAGRVVFSLASILVCVAGFTAYYNWRVTKNPLEFPYVIEQRDYLTSPVFVWQQAKPPIHYTNAQFESFYSEWAPSLYHTSWSGAENNSISTALQFWEFFLGSALSVPFLMLPWLLRDRRMRLPLIQFGISFLGLLAVVWFHPHYAAPLLATTILLVVQAFRHLRAWRYRGQRVGVAVVRLIGLFVVFMPIVSFLMVHWRSFLGFWLPSVEWLPPRYTLALIVVALALILLALRNRGQTKLAPHTSVRFASLEFFLLIVFVWQASIEQQLAHPMNFPDTRTDPSLQGLIRQRLASLPGEHLVLVRYSARHDVHQEYVYNDADIDHSKTVWAREIPGEDLRPLLEYFQNRDVWVFEPDERSQSLYPYSTPKPAQ